MRGLNQHELAKMAGVNQSTVSLIEAGKRLPSIQFLLALLDALDAELLVLPKEDIEHHPHRLDRGDP